MPALSGADLAYQYAIAAGCRAGATRSDYFESRTRISIGGVTRTGNTVKNLVINTSVTAQPNTCRFECVGFTPTRGMEVVVSNGSATNRIFAGVILSVTPHTANRHQRVQWHVDCVDYTWLLDTRRVSGRKYTASAPATIIADLMSAFAPTGFTTSNVETGLDNVDFTTNHAETLMHALVRLMKMASKGARKGGYCYIDYNKDVHAFVTPESSNNPAALLTTGANFWDFEYASDMSQTRTRTFVLGATTQTTSAVPNTAAAIPVDDTASFSTSGGYALSYGNQLRYTGTSPASGAGWLTGVTSFAYSLPRGESVRILAIAINSNAASSITGILGSGDGLIDHVIEDERLSATGAQNRADADVGLYGVIEESVAYLTRDKFALSGKTLPVSLTVPTTISAQLIVQSVEISDIGIGTHPRFPLRRVTAGTIYRDIFEILASADQASTEGAV